MHLNPSLFTPQLLISSKPCCLVLPPVVCTLCTSLTQVWLHLTKASEVGNLPTPHLLTVSKFLLTGAVLFWLPQSQRTFQTLLTNVWLNWADSYLSLIGIGFNEIRISVLTFDQTETHTSNIFILHVLSLPRIVIGSRNITSKVGNM